MKSNSRLALTSLLFCLILSTSGIAIAQKNTVDSLHLVLSKAISGKDKLRTMNLLTRVWGERNIDSALYVNGQAIALATKEKDTIELAVAYFYQARVLAGENRFDRIYRCHTICKEALQLLENEKFVLYRTWIEAYANSLVARTFNVNVLTNKTFVTQKDKYMSDMRKSRDTFLEQGDQVMAALVQEDILMKEVQPLQNNHFEKTALLCGKVNYWEGLTKLARIRGTTSWYSRASADANSEPKALFKRAVMLARQTGNLYEFGRSINGLAYCLLAQKKYDSAFLCAKQAEETALKMRDAEQLMRYQQTFFDLYLGQKQGDKALPYIEKYLALKDSIIGQSTTFAISEMETRNKILEQEQEMKLSEIKHKQERFIFIAVSAGLIVVLSLVVLIFRNRQRYLKKIREVELNAKIRYEKERIAQDLHDNIGTQLTMVASGLNKLSKESVIDSDKVEHLHESMNATLVELRDTIWAINKDEVTLEEIENRINTLFWRLRQNNASINFQIILQGPIGQQKLRPTEAVNIFRIIQEALNNSLKHSGATEVTIELERKDNQLQVTFNDNGSGFHIDQVEQVEHYGLGNMKKRAKEIAAYFSLTSEPGVGTRIQLQLNIP